MTRYQHTRTLAGPIIMVWVLLLAFAFRLADRPAYGLAVVLLYSLLWSMAPRIATVIAVLTLAFVLGDLAGALTLWSVR